jgi:hypothetical protein
VVLTLWLLLISLAIGLVTYAASSGHVIFLPLLVVIPLAWLFRVNGRG